MAHILEGSLQKAGDQVRINVQLVDVQNGLQAWSEKYDRKLDNVFAVEDEIAKAIATKLRVQLTGGAGQPLVVDSTNNPQAHELYLRGLTLLAARGPGLRRSKGFISTGGKTRRRLRAGVGRVGHNRAAASVLSDSTRSTLRSREASRPRNALFHSILTRPRPTSRSGSRILFDAAGPKPTRHSAAPLCLHQVTRKRSINMRNFFQPLDSWRPALREIVRAQQLDPLSPIIGVIHAGALDSLRRDGAARGTDQETLAAYPEFEAAQAWAAAQYIDRKMYPEAEAELRSLGKLNGQNGDAKASLARGMADPAQRVAAVNSLETSPDNADIRQDAIWYAFYLISLGERGRALDELEIYAVKHNSAFAGWLWNRGFDPLRDEPRFKAVLAKLALPTLPAVTER